MTTDERFFLAVFWLAYASSWVLTIMGHWTQATYVLGLAILARLIFQESRD